MVDENGRPWWQGVLDSTVQIDRGMHTHVYRMHVCYLWHWLALFIHGITTANQAKKLGVQNCYFSKRLIGPGHQMRSIYCLVFGGRAKLNDQVLFNSRWTHTLLIKYHNLQLFFAFTEYGMCATALGPHMYAMNETTFTGWYAHTCRSKRNTISQLATGDVFKYKYIKVQVQRIKDKVWHDETKKRSGYFSLGKNPHRSGHGACHGSDPRLAYIHVATCLQWLACGITCSNIYRALAVFRSTY